MKLCFASLLLKHGGWGGSGGVEVIWTKSKRTATFFSHEAFPKSHISRKKINRLLFSGLYPTRQLGRSRFWNKILNPISEAYRGRDLIIATAGLAPNIPWKENMLISPEKPVQVQNEKLERTSIYESPFLYHTDRLWLSQEFWNWVNDIFVQFFYTHIEWFEVYSRRIVKCT